jgi:hypothetical protein
MTLFLPFSVQLDRGSKGAGYVLSGSFWVLLVTGSSSKQLSQHIQPCLLTLNFKFTVRNCAVPVQPHSILDHQTTLKVDSL